MAPHRPYLGRVMCEGRAVAALAGVGAALAGEWREWSGVAFHIRRRLTAAEGRGLEIRDVRHTAEARRRLATIPARCLAVIPPDILAQEV